jgi:hypothetical protein
MNFRSLIVLGVALATYAAFSQDLAPEVLMLARIKAHMRHELAQVPNFTCVECFARSHKSAGPSGTMRPLDTLQLEVAHIGGRELFSWLGETTFKEDDPAKFIGSGMISTGVFVSFLRTLFVNDNGLFKYGGEVDFGGRRAVCYSFEVSPNLSGYTINLDGASGTVGLKGSIWADPQSFDLLRLEIHAYEIPPFLPLADAITIIDYARMHVGTADVLMPQTADVRLIRLTGEEDRNTVEFTHCRSFNTDSNISFTAADTPTPVTPSPQPVPSRTALEIVPGGLLVSIVLTTPVTEQAPIGQMIEAKVSGNVRYNNQLLIPDGSVVRGRVHRLERNSQPESYFIVALEFNEIQAGASLLRFYADLQNIEEAPGVERFLSYSTSVSDSSSPERRISPASGHEYDYSTSHTNVTSKEIRLVDLPGIGSFFVRGTHFSLPTGLKMTWKTRALAH